VHMCNILQKCNILACTQGRSHFAATQPKVAPI
jgi:hypothetical protein